MVLKFALSVFAISSTVIHATDGKEGLELVLSQKPDLVLLDITMPVLDGLSVMKQLREASDYGKLVPIILLTNLASDEEITRQISQDEPAYYLIKSQSTTDTVVAKVKQRLGV